VEREIAVAQERLSAATRDKEELEDTLHLLSSAKAKAAAAQPKQNGPPPGQPPSPKPAEVLALMEANPELHSLFKRAAQGRLSTQYFAFYQSAGLTSDQIQKFEALMTQDAEDKLDLAAIMQKERVAANDPTAAKMRQLNDAKLKAAQRDVLGEAGYQQLEQFARMEPSGRFVTEVASFVGDTSTPLTGAQGIRLMELIANASTTYQSGGKATPANVDWPRVLEEAKGFLAPTQVSALNANAQLPQLMTLVQQFYQQQGAPMGK
jgi:hypothetical protein